MVTGGLLFQQLRLRVQDMQLIQSAALNGGANESQSRKWLEERNAARLELIKKEAQLQLLADPSSRRLEIHPAAGGKQEKARGTLAVRGDGSAWVLVLIDLPAGPEGQRYTAWLSSGTEEKRLGVVPDEAGGLRVLTGMENASTGTLRIRLGKGEAGDPVVMETSQP
jgi:hypothetical protein